MSGRSPHGERGLKSSIRKLYCLPIGRSPHGERGLKSVEGREKGWQKRSLPSRGAWIEIIPGVAEVVAAWSLPSRGAWIEIKRRG